MKKTEPRARFKAERGSPGGLPSVENCAFAANNLPKDQINGHCVAANQWFYIGLAPWELKRLRAFSKSLPRPLRGKSAMTIRFMIQWVLHNLEKHEPKMLADAAAAYRDHYFDIGLKISDAIRQAEMSTPPAPLRRFCRAYNGVAMMGHEVGRRARGTRDRI